LAELDRLKARAADGMPPITRLIALITNAIPDLRFYDCGAALSNKKSNSDFKNQFWEYISFKDF
jgi:hypothetical protein